MKSCIDADLQKLRRMARSYCCKRGYAEIAEDFAQEATFSLSRGRKASLEQLLIDFLRGYYGSTRHGGKSSRHAHTSLYHEDGEEKCTDTDQDAARGDLLDFGELGNALKGNQRIVFHLTHTWGLLRTEVADVLGVSESRVSQVYGQIMRTQKEKLTQRESPEIQGALQPGKPREVSQDLQERSFFHLEKTDFMAAIFTKEGTGMGQEAFRKVSW